MRVLVLACAFLTFSSPVSAQTVDKAESRVEVRADGSAGRITNRTFEVIRSSNEHAEILLRKEVQERFQETFEGGPGRVRLDAWKLPRVRGSKPLYSIVEPGDSISWLAYHELLAVNVGACCSSTGTQTIFNAKTGKKLAYANGEGTEHGFLATVKKDCLNYALLIGVHDDHGGKQPPMFSREANRLQLLVTTADTTSCRRQLFFEIPVPLNSNGKVKLETQVNSVAWDRTSSGKTSGLEWTLSKTGPFDADLKILFSDGRTVVLPVGDAGIDSSKVSMPEGTKMTLISPCRL